MAFASNLMQLLTHYKISMSFDYFDGDGLRHSLTKAKRTCPELVMVVKPSLFMPKFPIVFSLEFTWCVFG